MIWTAPFGVSLQETGALLYIRRLTHFPAIPYRGKVVLMGDGRWAKVLRFVVCVLIILWMLAYTSLKAC